MTLTSIGDMSQQFAFMRNTATIKSSLATLSNSLSTGKVADLASSMNGDTTRYSAIQYDLSQLQAYEHAAIEADILFADAQTTLDRLEQLRGEQAERLLSMGDLSSASQTERIMISASQSLTAIVDTLNARIGDRSLFAGNSVDISPLASADDMLTAMEATIPTGSSAEQIVSAIEDWFDGPSSGFSTMGYRGDQGPLSHVAISQDRSIDALPRADAVAFVELLKAGAISAMSDRLAIPDQDTSRMLLEEAGKRFFAASDSLTAVRAEIGYGQELIANALSQNRSQRAAMNILSNNLDGADPFETATELQAVQLRLETHFTAMSRLSQLSLLRYL